MKTIKALVIGAALAFAPLLSTSLSAADASGNLTFPGISQQNLGDQVRVIFNQKNGLPNTIAAAANALGTNLNFPIIKDATIGFYSAFAMSSSNASGSSNSVIYIELTPDGQNWASATPYLLQHANGLSNDFYKKRFQWLVSTNFGAAIAGRIYSISNSALTGQGIVYPSNITVVEWRSGPKIQ